MKIVYCVATLGNSGGIERVLSTKTNYFVESFNYDVHIIIKEKKPEHLFYTFSDKIHLHYLNIPDVKLTPWNILFRSNVEKQYEENLIQLLNQIKPDITISVFGSEISFLYKIMDGSKKIMEFHYSYNHLTHLVNALPKSKLKFLRRIWVLLILYRERYFAKKYDALVVLTEKDKELWGGGNKIVAIPNPLSFVSDKKSNLENKNIIAMGRYMATKGFDLLIEAFRPVATDYPDWKLFIFGDGQDKEYLQELINKLSLQNNIFLQKPIFDVESMMLKSSIFVFPSKHEGFGLVLTEAMTCGVPCVAFDCECGPSAIIKNGEDGFLVPVGDIKDLTNKMKLLISDQNFRKELGEKAKINVMRFDVNVIMKLWQIFFSNLLNEI